jgi:hypothetical protein
MAGILVSCDMFEKPKQSPSAVGIEEGHSVEYNFTEATKMPRD